MLQIHSSKRLLSLTHHDDAVYLFHSLKRCLRLTLEDSAVHLFHWPLCQLGNVNTHMTSEVLCNLVRQLGNVKTHMTLEVLCNLVRLVVLAILLFKDKPHI